MGPKVNQICNYYFPIVFMSDSRKGDRITVVSASVIHIKTTLKRKPFRSRL